MDREVRYCKTEDGVRIAFCAEGAGPPLIMCPSRGESFSFSHLSPELETFVQRLGRGRRLIRYDERGTGLSSREVEDRSCSGFSRDIAAVADAAGLERFSLWATALSGPRAVRYAAEHPDRVERLILHGTTLAACGGFTREILAGFAAMARHNWKLWSGTFMDLSSSRKSPELVESLAQMMFESTTGESAALTLEAWAESEDLTAMASTLTMPVLLLHGTEDLVALPALGYDIGAVIRDVRIVSLTGGVSLYFLGDNDVLFRAIDEFLPIAQPDAASGANERQSMGVRTILFTDLVGHTAMMQRLGDIRGREVLREHERITRGVLHQHMGDEIKTMGDGFMASFASVTTAMECAVALQRAFAERNSPGDEPLNVRVGLNAGEPIEEDGDLFGTTVILAARIAAKADGGEILIPEPVRHLLGGKEFLYADRGTFIPKGFEDAVRLYEVRWQH
jgi:class 3 adenylate cyclase/alpha-beta hydrolase superfamily lysophospholipase